VKEFLINLSIEVQNISGVGGAFKKYPFFKGGFY
jgi:hypothetical protein